MRSVFRVPSIIYNFGKCSGIGLLSTQLISVVNFTMTHCIRISHDTLVNTRTLATSILLPTRNEPAGAKSIHERGLMLTICKQKFHLKQKQMTADNGLKNVFLMTVRGLFDDLITTWWLLENCLTTASYLEQANLIS